MVFEEVPFRYNILASVLSWIVLAGFLILPTAFPEIEMIMKNSHKMNPPPELRFLEKLSLYVPLSPFLHPSPNQKWSLWLTCGIKSTDLYSALPAVALA